MQQAVETLQRLQIELLISIGEASVTQVAKLAANELNVPLIIIPTTLSQNHFSGHVLLSDSAQFCYVPRVDYVIFDTNFLQYESAEDFKR